MPAFRLKRDFPLVRVGAFAAILVCACGCTRLGPGLDRSGFEGGATLLQDILDDLRGNDELLHSFQATGKSIVQSPDLESVQLLPNSTIYFQKPFGLYVVGRKFGGTVIARITSGKKDFLIEFPLKNEYYTWDGEAGSGSEGEFSPVEMVREAFLPMHWAEIPPKAIVLEGVTGEGAAREALLLVRLKARESRNQNRVAVGLVSGRWVVLRSEVVDANAVTVAITTFEAYHEQDGIVFPTRLKTTFPGKGAELSFDMKRFTLNEPMEEKEFDVHGKLEKLRREGYRSVDSPQKDPAL